MKSRIIVSILLLTLLGSVIYFGNYEKYSLVNINKLKVNEEKSKNNILDLETDESDNVESNVNKESIILEDKKTNINKESVEKDIKIKNEVNEIQNNDAPPKKEILNEELAKESTNVIIENKEESKIEAIKTAEKQEEQKVVEEIKPLIKTEEEINDELRKSIENQYGLLIKYGEEIGDYILRGYSPTKLLDAKEINENLNNIKTHIAYYPIGFFKEMKDFGMPLTIYLVKNIPGSDIAGITDKEFYDDIKITICTDQFFFRVFHHEIYHYIEAYMEVVGYNNGIFDDWNLLNPEGFNYGTTNSGYSYSLLNPVDNAYFINDYGQTNDREDRATIFEDLMARGYELNNSYVESNTIWTKGKFIAEEIDRYFNTVSTSTTERWERFIYN